MTIIGTSKCPGDANSRVRRISLPVRARGHGRQAPRVTAPVAQLTPSLEVDPRRYVRSSSVRDLRGIERRLETSSCP